MKQITRRSFGRLMAGATLGGEPLLRAALGPAGLGASGALGSQANPPAQGVGLTSRCFLINGRPEFVISGAIHYQRCPHQLWRDRILKAKRAGLNCVETYVPWNFHEPEEGKFNFEGDRDLGKFVDICHDLGLYSFLRVGPFVCGEWDAGAHPAWLIAKPGVEFRTTNAVAQSYIRRWFEQLIPQIAARQVTRGGPVILVQAENEWLYCDRPSGMEYLQFLIRTLRELGIEVPVTDCDGLDLKVPNSLKTVAFSEENIARFRKEYPDWPAMVYELYPDYGEMWGQPSVMPYSSPAVFRQTIMQALALRTMYNYYTFHGGTNFAFWACNTWKSDHSFITTRYYSTSPVAEGGALNDMYFAAKGANLLSRNFRDFFSRADEAQVPVGVEGPVRLLSLRSPQGFMLFVLPRQPVRLYANWHADGRSPNLFSLTDDRPNEEMAAQPGFLRLPSGRSMELAEGSAYPLMVPYQFRLDDGCRLDFANATLLGYGGSKEHRLLVFRGEVGRRGIVSVNGQEKEFIFPPDEPVQLNIGGATIFALSRETADRTWFAEERILIGPSYVGEFIHGQHECWLDGRSGAIHTLSAEGAHRRIEVAAEAPPPGLIRLTHWISRAFPEVAGQGEDWREISGPKSVEELGAYYGYTWYRASFDSDTKRTSQLLFTRAADRIHVFLRGRRVGVWGRGRQATRDPLPVELEKGKNEFVFLCDNMGRTSEGKTNDRKGILSDVYLDATPTPLGAEEWAELAGPPQESWEFRTYRCYSGRPSMRFFRVRYQLSVNEREGAVLALRWIPHYVWIHLNGHPVGEHGGDQSLVSGSCFNEFILDPYLTAGRAELELTFFGEPTRDLSEHVYVFTYPQSKSLQRWRFKSWQESKVEGSVQPPAPLGWESGFARPEFSGPLFLVTAGLSKGQAYLNGIAVGRYWEIGPQHSLYLPEPWLQEQNRIALFDEDGNKPDQVYLLRDPRVPFRKVLA